MNKFLKKVQKLEHKHLHELAILCGSMALLLIVTVFISAGVPKPVYAWNIPIYYFTSTPVEQGGNTTISWYASSAQYCTLTGPTLPCTTSSFFPGFPGTKTCQVTTYGVNPGSINQARINTGPINGPTSYSLSCYSPAGCSWGCNDGRGSASMTVVPTVPTATTLTSFSATPPSVLKGKTTTLSWSGTKGTHFSACEITGGQYGSGAWFTALPGSATTNALTANTTYNMNCVDTNGTQTGWKSASVAVTAPLGVCNDIPTQAVVPNGCVTPVPSPGICIPTGGSYSVPSNTCSCPAGKHLSGTSCVANPLCGNGLANSYAPSCTCPSGQYQPLGASSCVVMPVCANGLNSSYSPSCTCPSGQAQSGAACVLKGAINTLTVNPSRVLKGSHATISWSTSNMTTCALSLLDATHSSTLSSTLTSSLVVTINSKTIYTLSCADKTGSTYSSSVTVNLIPQTIEQ